MSADFNRIYIKASMVRKTCLSAAPCGHEVYLQDWKKEKRCYLLNDSNDWIYCVLSMRNLSNLRVLVQILQFLIFLYDKKQPFTSSSSIVQHMKLIKVFCYMWSPVFTYIIAFNFFFTFTAKHPTNIREIPKRNNNHPHKISLFAFHTLNSWFKFCMYWSLFIVYFTIFISKKGLQKHNTLSPEPPSFGGGDTEFKSHCCWFKTYHMLHYI